MNALFLSQLKNMPWVYNDLVVDVDGEALTVATLIERYKELKKVLTEVKSMSEPTVKTKPKNKSRTRTKTEK